MLTVPPHGSFVIRILPTAQFNACSFGRLGSNSRQSSDGSDGGAGAGGAGGDARGDHGGGAAAGPAFFGVGGGGFDLAGFGGGLQGRASGGAHPGASSGPRLGLAALRFLVRSWAVEFLTWFGRVLDIKAAAVAPCWVSPHCAFWCGLDREVLDTC